MFDSPSDSFWDNLTDKVAEKLMKLLLPRIELLSKVQPRYLDYESAGAYISKNYGGMRHTIEAHKKELPVLVIGGKPRIDIKDIDRLCQKLKDQQG